MRTADHIYTHLGKAPFTLVDYELDESGRLHACDHCGRGIKHVFHVKSADGKRFTLGSEHAKYLGDDGLVANIKLKMAELRREARYQADREWRRAEAERQSTERVNAIAKIKAEYKKVLPTLKATPHPNSYFASQGKTMLDYLEYFRADIFKSIEDQEDNWWFYNSKVRHTIREAGGEA